MFRAEDIRADFPILSRKVYGKPLVYLDSGATAQKPSCVIDKIDYLYRALNSNIHRGVHHLSEEMTSQYEQARRKVQTFIGAKYAHEVIFTAGATASINLVAYAWGDANISAGDNVIVSEMEHHSNIVVWQQIALRKGAELRILPFDDSGEIDMEMLDSLLDAKSKLVAITQASNTLGTRPNLKLIIEKAHSCGAKVMVDGCQGAVHGGVDVVALGCDFYAFSGHKLYGPTGIGVLYGREELLDAMPPFHFGGDMVDRVSFEKTTFAPLPLKLEAGTSNFVGAIGLGEAIDYISRFDAHEIESHEKMLLDMLTSQLMTVDGMQIYGTSPTKCGIVSFNVDGVHHLDLGMILDKMGVAIRTGQHCAEPTMKHFGITGMCRASLAMYNTEEDVNACVTAIKRAVVMLK